VITDTLRSMPWGVEHLTQKDRHKTMVLAGVDQLLSENDPKYVLECVREGSIPEERITASARRILRAMFRLGLFENPYVDPENTRKLVGNPEYVQAGFQAQVRSVVLLKNANDILPLPAGKKIFAQHIDAAAAAKYGTVVDDPKQADFALIKITTPAIVYPFGGGFGFGGGARGGGREGGQRARAGAVEVPLVLGNTLAYTGSANQKQLEDVLKLAAAGTPVIVCVEMDRPTILTEFIDEVQGVLASFGVTDAAWLAVAFGEQQAAGKLPFDLPSDMPSVAAQNADAAHDLEDPLFRFGFGLRYKR
jgi:beta-glucosidase